MSAYRPRITDVQRRNRLLRRHCLAPGHRGASVLEVADAMVGLHATTPSTVYLSAWARTEDLRAADVDSALYDDRTLIKQLAMRRTLFVFSGAVLGEAVGAIGSRVAGSERTNMLRDLRRSEDAVDPEGWIDTARAAIRAEFADGTTLTSAELRARLPEVDRQVIISPGKSYGGPSPLIPRVLNMMSAAGEVVRGPNNGGWHVSRPSWSAMDRWLRHPLDVPDVAAAHAALIRRWLARFGPGTEADLVWWLGSTKRDVRQALTTLGVAEVELDDGSTGYVLADDLPGGPDDEPVAPAAILLPELDPTTMGHKARDFYLGPHAGKIFDRNGNGGQTVWWDGRIVGGWYRGGEGSDGRSIDVHLFEDLSSAARRAVAERADELTAWLGDVAFRPGYPPPYLRELTPRR
ncbi:winged helix DNA-binding domain-containing protein [Gordonia sp. DT30]|uniref:winged helix DNA-binding domain-containing protein n=1 Tax=unclassified Gordonia (in: high G+C Gram-positive bacteria) TaxID=2657482 RepID=UPI003CF9F335